MAGITSTGFVKLTLAEIKAELETTYRAKYGKSVNLRPPSLMATDIGIQADREANLWDLAEECWNARGASTSQGVSLDNAGELTIEERLGALPSRLLLQYFWGVIGTIIPTTFQAAVENSPLSIFSPEVAVTLAAGTDEVQHIAFSATPDAATWAITMPDGQVTGALAFNASAADIQTAIRLLDDWDTVTVTGNYSGFVVTYTGGVIGKRPWALLAAAGSITHTSTPVVITVSETTLGVAQAVASMVASTTGPITANALSLNQIVTPITGLTATNNGDDATIGRNVETDADYRIRREEDVQSTARTTPEGIRTAIKAVLNVAECIVYTNVTLVTDVNSVPAKSVHIYVSGGTDADVADAIWKAVGGGISTYGATVVSITDSQGLAQTVKFDRPTAKPVFVIVDVTTDSTYPSGGDALVKAAVVAFGATLKIGDDVLLYPKLLPAIVDNVIGITDITIKIGFSAVPTLSANLVLAANELATFSTANVSVV